MKFLLASAYGSVATFNPVNMMKDITCEEEDVMMTEIWWDYPPLNVMDEYEQSRFKLTGTNHRTIGKHPARDQKIKAWSTDISSCLELVHLTDVCNSVSISGVKGEDAQWHDMSGEKLRVITLGI